MPTLRSGSGADGVAQWLGMRVHDSWLRGAAATLRSATRMAVILDREEASWRVMAIEVEAALSIRSEREAAGVADGSRASPVCPVLAGYGARRRSQDAAVSRGRRCPLPPGVAVAAALCLYWV